MRRYLFLAILSYFLSSSNLNAVIIETDHIEDALPFIDQDTWFLVDLDNCMFEAAQALGHANWFYDVISQKMQTGMTQAEAIRNSYPDWIRTQKICRVKPVEPTFVPNLLALQQKGVVIMGLTHRQPIVADSTIQQVASLGFDFSKTAPPLQNHATFTTEPLYAQGVLFVGDLNRKIDVFNTFLLAANQKPKKVVFIDDKRKNVVELEELYAIGIDYIGVHYTAIEHAEQPVYLKEVAEFQYQFLDRILSNESALKLMQNGEFMNSRLSTISSSLQFYHPTEPIDTIETYFKNFECLAKEEAWDEIVFQGTRALQAARTSKREKDEAKICAQLTSTSFYQGHYTQALEYVKRCHELSDRFEDPCLFIRALYLESSVHRALAGKNTDPSFQQASYAHALKIAEEAAFLYTQRTLHNPLLKGKIYFNLGAAHADNPQGDLSEASRCYAVAVDCFKTVDAADDLVRTKIRLGKVYLLQHNYVEAENLMHEIRSHASNARITMHADYLEAQLKITIGDTRSAIQIAKRGMQTAEQLGAKEDRERFDQLLKKIFQ